MIGGSPDVQVVTIRELGVFAVLPRCHLVHRIHNGSPARRLSVHVMHAIDGEDVPDRSYGHVVHATPVAPRSARAQRAAITSISTE